MKRGMVIGIALVAIIVAVLFAARFLRRQPTEIPATPTLTLPLVAPVSPGAVSSTTAGSARSEAATPPSSAGTIPGFCCIRATGTCVPSTGAATCLHDEKGLVFDVREEKCREICMFLLLR
ncbi:hypothetical protein HYS30_00280 [Candidatus Peregrinibacteria bacterium]|nr:hypothetical protein [Candidatus Peregrinibacteria bacterium]